MSTTTMRVTTRALDTVRKLARQTGLKNQQVIEYAVESYRRQVFLESASSAYAKLASDSAAWGKEQQEREAWDETVADGDEG